MADTARQPSVPLPRAARGAGAPEAAAPRSLPERPFVRSPADVARIEEVPLVELGLPSSTYDLVLAAAEVHGDTPAHTHLATGGGRIVETLTYRQLADRVTRVARAIRAAARGAARPVTSFLVPQGPWAMPGQWGAQAVGVSNPVNPALTDDHVLGLLRAAGTQVLVVPSHRADPVRHARLAGLAGALPGLRAVFTLEAPADTPAAGAPAPDTSAPGAASPDAAAPVWPVPVRSLEEAALDHGEGRVVPPAADDICALFHTGGTTGRPKLAAHTHRNEVYTAWGLTAGLDLQAGETMLSGLPAFHVNATHATGLGPLFGGTHIVFLGPLGFRDTGAMAGFWRILERHRVATFSTVPTVLSVLTTIPVDADISRLRCVYSGAAALPDAVRRGFERHTGRPVLQGYGLTEGTCVSTITPAGADAPAGTVGLRLPYQQVRVVGADGAPAGDGEPGRVHVKGPNVFPGYWGEGLGDAVDEDGWLDTGDIGTLRGGWLFLGGRAKDLIIRGGHNIDPASIEDAMLAHPRVVAAAAVGRPDAHSGEVPVVYVQLGPGPGVPREELLDWARDHIGERAAVPKDVQVRAALPVTAVGKVNKVRLREDAAERAGAALLEERFPGAGPELTAATGPDGRIVLTAAPGPVPARLLEALAELPVTVRVAAPEAEPGAAPVA